MLCDQIIQTDIHLVGKMTAITDNFRDEDAGLIVNSDTLEKPRKRQSSPVVEIDRTGEKVQLQKSINLFSATAILIANTGGASVFIIPTSLLLYAGSPGLSLVLWLLGGLINFGLAFCFTEVGLQLSKAGGPYFYVREVFGSFPGFVMLWGFMLCIMAPSWALVGYTTALYITTLAFPDCEPSDVASKILAAWIIVSLMVLNCLYMKFVTKVQTFLSACKLVAMLIIIVAGLTKVSSRHGQENLQAFFEDSTTDPGALALGLVAGYFSYGGWQVITILMEEVENPVKNVPRSLIITFVVAISMYILTNFCYCVVLSPQELLKSDAVALLFAYRIHDSLPYVVSILVALCSMSVLNVLIMGQPRMLYAAGQVGHMPELIGMISKKYLTPWPATITVGILALVMLVSGTIQSLIETMSLYACVMVSSVLITQLYLRWKQPNAIRPLKVPIILPIAELTLSTVLVFLSVYKKPMELGLVLVIIAAGIPVYIVCIKWESKPKAFQRFMERITLFLKTLFHLEKPGH